MDREFLEHSEYDRSEERELRNSAIIRSVEGSVRDTPARFDGTGEQASVFFARELDYIKTKTYDVVYPQFNAINLFPVSSEASDGAETITYYTYDKTGTAKIIKDYSTDLPRADVTGKPTTVQVQSIGDSYGYSVQEMRASRLAHKSLDVRKAEAARFQIERKINQLAWCGDEESGLMGVLSEGQSIPMYVLPEGAESGSTAWHDKTADEILTDVNGMIQAVSTLTKDVEKPDTLLLPSNVYYDIASRRIPSTEAITVLEFVRKYTPNLKKIEKVPELNYNSVDMNPYAATDGTGKGVAFLYTNDPQKLTLEIPMPFLQHPLQIRGLETIIPCEARVAGVIVYYPMSAMIAVGV